MALECDRCLLFFLVYIYLGYQLAVNKISIGLLGSDRIGSDRIGLRIGLVSSLLVQKNYFDKSCFNNDTGGSE